MTWLDAPLIRALRQPSVMATFSLADWDLVLRQARSSQLLGRLGAVIRQAGIDVPPPVHRHLTAMDSIVRKQHGAVRWEVDRMAHALAAIDHPVLLLKGAAYVLAQGAAALGRTFSDIDILVPRSGLAAVEDALHVSGWVSAKTSEYDQRYYRKWMHEIPPLVHYRRETTLDVHHNILPETARIRVDPAPIFDARVPIAGFRNMHVPSLADQILHSACHLFHEGEWRHGLRDLSDLDLLLRAYLEEGTADALVQRARILNLEIPLTYAVSCAGRVFDTPFPSGAALRRRRWMEQLFLEAIRSAHHTMAGPLTGSAEGLLYVRSHWLRMPVRLLVPHLLHQAVRSRQEAVA
ncbi:nucleotidyltransferase family protein [Pseudorhodoferax sp.]|uniref:nucleotidyltransferase domain-containing protein n=1 Tax=Pseudorhodoferax sp. TaxID=1993553 RepID=UPI0039E26901